MKITEVKITGFGNLSNVQFNFDKLSMLNRANGWGKTTLASFIKAMFYGFGNTRTKKLSERERYRPWHKGSYGGSLTFIENGITYRITRSFGENAKNDKFTFYNDTAGSVSRDFLEDVFPLDNIGQGIFGVGVETFERSVFITLDKNKKATNTSDITARLNNLIQNNDMAEFNKAVNSLRSQKKSLQSKAAGLKEIPYLNDFVAKCLIDLNTAHDKAQNLGSLKNEEEKLHLTLSALLKEQKNIQEAFAQNELNLKQKQWANLQDSLNAAKMQCKKCEDEFGGVPPTLDVVENKQKWFDRYLKLLQDIKQKSLTEQEQSELFELQKLKGLDNIKQSDIDIAYKCLNDEEDLLEKTRTLQNDMAGVQQTITNSITQKPIWPRKKLPLIILGAVLILLGCTLLFILRQKIFFTPLILVGVAVFIAGVLIKAKPKDISKETSKLQEIKSQLDELNRKITDNKSVYQNFIALIEPATNNARQSIMEIHNKVSRYKILCDKKHNFDIWFKSLQKTPDDYKAFINEFMNEWANNNNQEIQKNKNEVDIPTVTKLLDKAKIAAIEYKINKRNFNEALNRLNTFKSENASLVENFVSTAEDSKNTPTQNISSGPVSNIADLKNKMNSITQKIASITKEIAGNENMQKDSIKAAQDIDKIDTQMQEAKELLDKKMKRVFIIEKTLEHLEASKKSLEDAYIDPLSKHFNERLKSFEMALKLSIKPTMEVAINGEGEFYSGEYLSAGESDIVNIATRLALFDCIFKDSKPPIILDDPFVNLDDKSVALSKQIIKTLAKDTQVIYLTCNNSRIL